jgi:hypothetical protein
MVTRGKKAQMFAALIIKAKHLKWSPQVYQSSH